MFKQMSRIKKQMSRMNKFILSQNIASWAKVQSQNEDTRKVD
jgi:hypothetical protein